MASITDLERSPGTRASKISIALWERSESGLRTAIFTSFLDDDMLRGASYKSKRLS
jgi:hypothetical protein